MKNLKTIITVLIVLMLFFGCSLDFLSGDGGEEEAAADPDFDTWDASTDTKYHHDGETEAVIWYETYDYDDAGNCILVKRSTRSDTLLYSYLYTWE